MAAWHAPTTGERGGQWIYSAITIETGLGMDADTHEIVAVELTPDDVGDVSEIPESACSDRCLASMTADRAYDGEAVYKAAAERHPEAAVIIPPRAAAVVSETTATQCDRHIAKRSKSTGASPGNVVQATIDGVWLKPRCSATRPSSVGDFRPGLCPIGGPKQKSAATCSTG